MDIDIPQAIHETLTQSAEHFTSPPTGQEVRLPTTCVLGVVGHRTTEKEREQGTDLHTVTGALPLANICSDKEQVIVIAARQDDGNQQVVELSLNWRAGGEAATATSVCYEVVRYKGRSTTSSTVAPTASSSPSARLLALDQHMQRLEGSLRTVYNLQEEDLLVNRLREAVSRAHVQLLDFNSDEVGQLNIKSCVWEMKNGEHGEGKSRRFAFVVTFIPSLYPTEKQYEEGVPVVVLADAHRGPSPNAKVAPRHELLARVKHIKTRFPDAFEVLLADPLSEVKVNSSCGFLQSVVPEGSRSNYLAVCSDGTVLCSEDRQILVGVTLTKVRAQCRALKIPFLQREITLGDLFSSKGEEQDQEQGGATSGTTQLLLPDKVVVVALAILGTSPGVLPVNSLRYPRRETEGKDVVVSLDCRNSTLRRLMELYEAPLLEATH